MKVIVKPIPMIILLLVSCSFAQDLDDLEFGSDHTLDIMTWNIEWFPKNGQVTVSYVAQILTALDMDIIAIQEVDNITMFEQLVDLLPGYEGYLESAWFAGLAYIYKTDTIEIDDLYEIYITAPYWSPFPRSPMVMDFYFMNVHYVLINNHFKCCGDGILEMEDESDEETRRYLASSLLKEYIDTYFVTTNVIVLGDLNDILTDAPQNNVFQMILDDPQHYLFTDMEIAEGNSSNWSYPSWPSHIDHIFINNELFDIFARDASYCETIPVDEYMAGGFYQYDQNISDHRPIALKLDTTPIVLGDLNNDTFLDILDVVVLVILILDAQYQQMGDMNSDGILDVQDVVSMVSTILN